MPPGPEIDTGQWPPISSRKLIKQFNSAPQKLREETRSGQETTYNQLPKLAQDHSLRALTDQMVRAWGVHFEEGWHWITVWYLVCAMVWISLLAGISWSVTAGDVQSVFAVNATIILVAPPLIGVLAVRNSRQ